MYVNLPVDSSKTSEHSDSSSVPNKVGVDNPHMSFRSGEDVVGSVVATEDV